MPRTKPYAQKSTFVYSGPKGSITLDAYTTSEARALFKKKLGFWSKGRLPVGAVIDKFDEGVK